MKLEFKTDVQTLCELVIEYCENGNAAGEYDGNDPRLQSMAEDTLKNLAFKVKQAEEMRIWNL